MEEIVQVYKRVEEVISNLKAEHPEIESGKLLLDTRSWNTFVDQVIRYEEETFIALREKGTYKGFDCWLVHKIEDNIFNPAKDEIILIIPDKK